MIFYNDFFLHTILFYNLKFKNFNNLNKSKNNDKIKNFQHIKSFLRVKNCKSGMIKNDIKESY